jgi:hypothetical protein
MARIVRLTESDINRLVRRVIMETKNKVNFFSSMESVIDLCFESAIEVTAPEETEDYNDYKYAVFWSTLSILEDGFMPEIQDKNLVEEFLKYMKKYIPQIKKRYTEYQRMN